MLILHKSHIAFIITVVLILSLKHGHAQSLDADTSINLSAIIQKFDKQQAEIVQVKAANSIAGIKIQQAGELQYKSFRTMLFGSALGGMLFLASGNVALWSAISGTSAIVATAQKLKSNR